MTTTKLVEHLNALVGLYPVTSNQDAVLAVLSYCQNILSASGSFKDITLHNNNGIHSLTASTQGIKTPKLLLQGHVDVVPAPVVMQQFVQQDDALYGRGVFDMLFATAGYLTFIEKHQEELANLDFGLMLTGDEEHGGAEGVKYLLDQGYSCEVCLLPDAGDHLGALSVSSKGAINFDVVVSGRAHHGSRPWEGDGAANKLVLLLNEFLRAFDTSDRYNSTLTVTKLQAGDAPNKGPSTATAHVDIRYKNEEDLTRIKEKLDQLYEKYDACSENIGSYDSHELDLNNVYVKQFVEVYARELDAEVEFTRAHGASDAGYFDAYGIPVIMFRPDGGGAHGDEEYLSLKSFEQYYRIFEAFTLETAKIQ